MENVVNLIKRTLPKVIELEPVFGDDLAKVNADSVQVEQLLMNLCLNAKEAMPDGGSIEIGTGNVMVDEVYCKSHLEAKPGPYVLIEVTDTGRGMDSDTVGHIFDPFFTTKGWDYNKGTGLGLSVAKGIVEQHGGWITCDSELERGTTFRVYFPVIEEETASVEPAPPSEPSLGEAKILLVDDEEYVRDLAKRFLEKAGYSVIAAANGMEALEVYEREQSNIALVVLDLIMPKMSGESCLEELVRTNPKLKVIVSSGHSLTAQERMRLGVHAKGFVNKPYQLGEFLETVKEVLAMP
jgi:two-component system cell cycle sensor histidine kinase/response regulator CckA